MSISHKELLVSIQQQFPHWQPNDTMLGLVDSLSQLQIGALQAWLQAEQSSSSSFGLRKSQYQHFYHYSYELNALMSELLASQVPVTPLVNYQASEWFPRQPQREETDQSLLKAKGYLVSPHRLSPELIDEIKSSIASETFINRGIFDIELSAGEIFKKIEDGSITKHIGKNGDTFWLKDLNQLVQKSLFQRLAFDPYILQTVTEYLGCCPVHVQTNVWFSFPTFHHKTNLSANAQMFHQDKEYTKFIKVFIYLTDVNDENGPHCYVEGSQIDEAHTYGVKFSERIPDDEITKYYNNTRIKTLLGPAGTMAFGDTSCVHKGMPVQSGYRLMLQLEYASSLYLSPVCPFINTAIPVLDRYNSALVSRLTKNYNSAERQAFMASKASDAPVKPRKFMQYLRLAKRYAEAALRN